MTQGGTPIPAVVPIPGRALAPQPKYNGEASIPGYPFYIAGESGHRVPQAPLDMHEDAGLPRHILLGGERTLLPLRKSLDDADFSVHLKTAQIRILPKGEPHWRKWP